MITKTVYIITMSDLSKQRIMYNLLNVHGLDFEDFETAMSGRLCDLCDILGNDLIEKILIEENA